MLYLGDDDESSVDSESEEVESSDEEVKSVTSPVRGRRYRRGQERGRGRGHANGRHVEKGDRLGCMEVGVALIVDLDNSTSPFEWEIANVSSPNKWLTTKAATGLRSTSWPCPQNNSGKHTVEDILFVCIIYSV